MPLPVPPCDQTPSPVLTRQAKLQKAAAEVDRPPPSDAKGTSPERLRLEVWLLARSGCQTMDYFLYPGFVTGLKDGLVRVDVKSGDEQGVLLL